MDRKKLEKQLVRHEGERLKPYRCAAGKLTIGIGHNIEDNGIPLVNSRLLLKLDIDEVVRDLNAIFDLDALPEPIQRVLADMRFQLGPRRFRAFKRMIAAVKVRDWLWMAMEMKDSAWYRQVPNRARNLIEIVESV